MKTLKDFWLWLKAEYRWRVLGKRYEVVMTEEAQRQLDELPENVQVAISEALESFSRNPYCGERVEEDEKVK